MKLNSPQAIASSRAIRQVFGSWEAARQASTVDAAGVRTIHMTPEQRAEHRRLYLSICEATGTRP